MTENMMNSNHKSSNKIYRDNYDRIFKKDGDHTSSEIEHINEPKKSLEEIMCDLVIKRDEVIRKSFNKNKTSGQFIIRDPISNKEWIYDKHITKLFEDIRNKDTN